MRPVSELLDMSAHLYYELSMFEGTAFHLANKKTSRDIFEYYALLESFLIHSRNLIDFLYAKGKDDDCFAAQFLAAPVEWEKNRPTFPEFLKQTKGRIDKKLAHLTFSRLEDTDPWDFIRIKKEIYKVFRDFFKKAPDDLLCGELVEFKSKIMRMNLDS